MRQPTHIQHDPIWLAEHCDPQDAFETACASALVRQHRNIQLLQDALGLVELWMHEERKSLLTVCVGHNGKARPGGHEMLNEHDSRALLVTLALRQSRAPVGVET